MSTSSMTSSLFTAIAGSSSTANQFAANLNQLAKDLQSGSAAAAEDDYVTLSEDALNGATASTATTGTSGITTSLLKEIASSTGSTSSFVSELNQLGTDLGDSDLSAAQQDMLALDSTALNAASSSSSSSTSSSTKTSSSADSAELIRTIVAGLETGDNSTVGTAMSELASISTSSDGQSILSQNSEDYGSSTGSSSNSISELFNSGSSNSSSSILSLLA